MVNLAWVVSHQFDRPSDERLAEAESLFRQVLRIRRAKLGDKHRDVGISMVALAILVFGKSKLEAGGLAVQGFKILERADNKDRASSGFAAYMQARAARFSRKFKESRKLYESVLSQATDLLGDEHPVVGLLLGDFAGLLKEMGDLRAAEQAIRKAIAIGRRSPLRGHPAMIEALVALADHVRQRGETKEAEALYREAIAIAERFDRPQLAQTPRSKLAELLRSQSPR